MENIELENIGVFNIDEDPTTLKKEFEVKENPNKHFNPFTYLLFSRPWKQIKIARKKKLEVEELGYLTSKLNVEKKSEEFNERWEKEKLSSNPSILKIVLQQEWKRLCAAIFSVCVSQFSVVITTFMLEYLISWFKDENANFWIGFAYWILITFFQICDCFGYGFSLKWIFILSLRVRNDLIVLIYNKALTLSSSGIKDTGKLINLMSNDAQILIDMLPTVIHGFAVPFVMTLSFIFLAILIGKWVLIPIGIILVCLVINYFIGDGVGIYYQKFSEAKDKRIGFFGEMLKSMKFIKYNAWEEPMQEKLKKMRNTELTKLVINGLFKSILITFLGKISSIISVVLFLVMVLTKQEMKSETIYSTIAVINTLIYPMLMFGFFIACFKSIKVSFGRIRDFLITPELKPIEIKRDKSSEYAIEMNNVEYKFPDGETAFSCNDLKIKKGELVCVLGSVGSGKSSFLLSILSELEQSGGDIKINGDITYASQIAWLMNTTVRENICFLEKYNKEKYEESCRCACLTRDLEILRGGDMYEVAERGANLSGGQRQRISIARALYNARDIVMFDDPLSAVDFQVGSFIFEHAISGQLKDKTRIIVTNQTYFIDKADRIIVIEDKKIAFNGSIEDLRKSDLEASQFVKTISKKEKKKKKKNNEENETMPQDVVATDVEEEERESGRVALKIYGKYFKFGKLSLLILCLIPFILKIGTVVCYNLFLSYWCSSINDENTQGDLFWFYAHIVAMFADMILNYITINAMSFFGAFASKYLHEYLVNNLLKTKLAFYDVTPIGRITNYFSRDFHLIDTRIPSLFEACLTQFCQFIALAIIICMGSYILVPVIVIVLILFVVFHSLVIRAPIEMQRLEGITRSPIFIHFDQTLLGLPTIRKSKGEETFKEKLLKKLKVNTLTSYVLQMTKCWYNQKMEWIGYSTATFGILVFVILKQFNQLNVGMASVALMNVTGIPATICILAVNLNELEVTMQTTERVLQLQKIPVEEPNEIKENYREPPQEWPTQGKIELQDYKFRYREGLPLVLKGVNATLEDKEKIGIVGRTGSGKSTMMAGLFRIEEPAGGKIFVDGIDTTTIPMKTLRSRMCILPQEATMFSGTIRSNLDPFNEKSEEEMKRVLELVNVEKGLDYEVAENGENFSLGERQMICMARALLRGAKILIMDEATASIDIQTDIMIQEMVRKNFQDCTTLTIAHRLHSIMDSNKVMVFDDGHLKEFDKPLTLIDEGTTIFNELVQKSGCAEELKRLAKGEVSIADTLRAEEAKKKEKEDDETSSSSSSDEEIEKKDKIIKPKASKGNKNSHKVNKENKNLLEEITPSPLPDNDERENISNDENNTKQVANLKTPSASPMPIEHKINKKNYNNSTSSSSNDE